MKIKKKNLKILIETFLFEENEDKEETPKETLENILKKLENLSPGEAYQSYYELSNNIDYKNIEHDLPQKVKDYFLDILHIKEDDIPENPITFSKLASDMSSQIKKAQSMLAGSVS